MSIRDDRVSGPDDDGPPTDECVECENKRLRRERAIVVRWLRASIIAVTVATAASVWGWVRQDAVDAHQDRSDAREAREEEVEAAQACVNQWTRVSELRGVIERLSGASAEAAVTAVGHIAINLYDPGSLPPDLLEQLTIEADINARAQAAEILQDYPDPDCSLADAERRIERAERAGELGG